MLEYLQIQNRPHSLAAAIDDLLIGESGADRLVGGDGSDVLIGGVLDDTADT